MAKKKNTVVEAPVTEEEYKVFLSLWDKLSPVLHILAPACSREVSQYGYIDYHHAEGFETFNDDGVWFQFQAPNSYESGYYTSSRIIPLEAILNPQKYLEEHEKALAEEAEKRAQKLEETNRALYEKLKARYE